MLEHSRKQPVCIRTWSPGFLELANGREPCGGPGPALSRDRHSPSPRPPSRPALACRAAVPRDHAGHPGRDLPCTLLHHGQQGSPVPIQGVEERGFRPRGHGSHDGGHGQTPRGHPSLALTARAHRTTTLPPGRPTKRSAQAHRPCRRQGPSRRL